MGVWLLMFTLLANIISTKNTIDNVVNKLFENDKQKLNKKELLKQISKLPNKEQLQINKLNARHKNVLVAGWRPFIGWVCGLNLVYLVCLRDILLYITQLTGLNMQMSEPIGMEMTNELVVILLGFGSLRTYEKCRGKD